MAVLRSLSELKKGRFNDEKLETKSSVEQLNTEWRIEEVYDAFHIKLKLDPKLPRLNRGQHWEYLQDHMAYLSQGFTFLDASRTWLCYWSLHSQTLLQCERNLTFSPMVQFLNRCQHVNGGFGGGPGQDPHLATTYAAINALCIIGTEEAYNIINRKTLSEFLMRMRSPDGSFFMHKDGEEDIRGVYCALSIATLTNIVTPELIDGTAEWIVSCQTYEGGFSGYPGMEAHGGYTFCGLAGLFLLDKAHLCDSNSLLRWLSNRQTKLEGGFQGRTNKLVDGCYSFWQAAAFALLHDLLIKEKRPPKEFLFNQTALQEYILICCQDKRGGLIDKPGKHSDLYHTCYTLSGLAVAQANLDGTPCILGPELNKIQQTSFIHNIRLISVLKAKIYFKRMDGEIQNATIAEL